MPDIHAMIMPDFWYSLSAAIAIVLAVKSIVIVGGTEIAMVERPWFGKKCNRAG